MASQRLPTSDRRSVRKTALKIVALYSLLSFIWLAAFDVLFKELDIFDEYETHGDAVFVVLTAILFYGLLVRFITRHDDIQRQLQEKAVLADRAWLIQKHNQELRSINAKLLASNSELEQFAYVASHDLREPLRHVSSYVALLEESCGEVSDETREYIGFARQGARRMDALITGLLDYCRLNRAPARLSEVDLGEVMAEVTATLSAAAGQCQGNIRVDRPLPRVKGDHGQLVRLFQNLLSNSLKYRDPARPPEVVVRATHDGEFWRVSVIDNGIGIPEQSCERVFGIFQRLHGRDEYEGTGIGLAVCRKIASHHGGDVHLRSVLGQGSEFIVSLPMVHEMADA